MKEEIVVPSMGESISEAMVGEILQPSGSYVELDQEILELETDKVNQVLYAPAAGVLSLNVETDDTVTIGQVLGHIETEGGAPDSHEEKPSPKKADAPSPKEKKEKEGETDKLEASKKEPPAPEPSGQTARKGKEAFLSEISDERTEKRAPQAEKSKESRKRMTKIRQVIASRLVEAQATTAMLTTFNEADMTAVMALRKQYKETFEKKHGVKLGFMSFFVKAVVSALQYVPGVNSYIDGNELVMRHTYDIGIAVGTDRGLIVPVVRDCDQLTFAEIEQGIGEYATKAREGTISVDDLKGGSFTITNGGIYGSLLSTPILNPPQSGILGMHKIEKRAVVKDDEMVIRPMMYLALSYDHRIVDGKEAVSFLVHVKECLEDPMRILLEV